MAVAAAGGAAEPEPPWEPGWASVRVTSTDDEEQVVVTLGEGFHGLLTRSGRIENQALLLQ